MSAAGDRARDFGALFRTMGLDRALRMRPAGISFDEMLAGLPPVGGLEPILGAALVEALEDAEAQVIDLTRRLAKLTQVRA